MPAFACMKKTETQNMATDYATLKKGGWMRQKQKNNFSLRVRVVGGNLTATQLAKIAEVAEKYGEG